MQWRLTTLDPIIEAPMQCKLTTLDPIIKAPMQWKLTACISVVDRGLSICVIVSLKFYLFICTLM